MTDSEKSQQEPAAQTESREPRGQVLVIFAGTFVVLLLMCSLVIDLAWLWSNTLRIQRAADAAALAGVVQLPNNVASAYNLAVLEAFKNGYDDADLNVAVVPLQDASSTRRLHVKITAPVKTFFLGLIGMGTVTVSRNAQAEFVLPVPMGSPENYYGVFGDVRNATMSTTGTTPHPGTRTEDFDGNTSNLWDSPNNNTAGCSAGAGNVWSNVGNTATDNNSYADTGVNTNSCHWFRDFTFGFTPTFVSVEGIEVTLRAFNGGSGTSTNCRLDVAMTWNAGTTWTATRQTGALTGSEIAHPLGGTSDLWTPPAHTWTTAELNNATNFRVRVTLVRPTGTATCAATRFARVDSIEVNVNYNYSTVGTTTATATFQMEGPGDPCVNGRPNCFEALPAGPGQPLNPRGFWATMNTEGAENVNGDAFQTYYDQRTGLVAPNCPSSTLRACYGPDDYYNYAIEMPPNSTGGYVYVFDPVFCDTALASGTGDRWFSGVGTGISSFYELYSDPNNTPYNFADDALFIPIDNTFRQIAASDSTMGGSGGSECRQSNIAYNDGRDYHNSWYLINPGNPLTGSPTGTIYRLHTTGTEKADPTQQRGANGEQSFAIYATNVQGPLGGAYPRVYGLGAMQMFTPLSASGSPTPSEFYLAQIPAVHKTKTLELQLWDPGDTSPLSAFIEILIPCAPGTPVTTGNCPGSGWTPARFSYFAQTGTANPNRNNACNTNSNASTTTVSTSTGASLGLFNGCWATISTVIPSWYTGGGGAATHDEWWKIRYTMNGTGTSSDVTTWAANIRGNPVHLIEP